MPSGFVAYKRRVMSRGFLNLPIAEEKIVRNLRIDRCISFSTAGLGEIMRLRPTMHTRKKNEVEDICYWLRFGVGDPCVRATAYQPDSQFWLHNRSRSYPRSRR